MSRSGDRDGLESPTGHGRCSIADLDTLVRRLERAKKRVAFLVGAPLSCTYAPRQGVPDVAGMVERVRAWADEEGMRDALDAHLRDVPSHAQYQPAFEFVQLNDGPDTVNRLVHEAVRSARLPDAPHDFDGDGEPRHWHLPRGTAALGRLVVERSERFGGPILTTNFDPLVSLAIEQAGGRVNRRSIASDGRLSSAAEHTGGVDVVHLHGYWRDDDTLHLPAQLTAERPQLRGSLRTLLRNQIVVVAAYGGWRDVFMNALADAAAEPGSGIEIIWALYPRENDARVDHKELLKHYLGHARFAFYYDIDAHALFDTLAAPPTAATLPVPNAASAAKSDERPIELGQPGVHLPRFDARPGAMVGGAALVARLRALLTGSGAATVGQVASAIGLGGIGKSRLAWEYAHAHRADYPGGVVWIDADQSAALIDQQLIQMARALRWVGPGADDASTLQMARAGLRELREALFVFDNVEGLDPLTPVRTLLDPSVHQVMTSRLELGGATLDMEHLGLEAGVELLEQASGAALDGVDRAAAERIVTWAEGLPLALELVGAYMKRMPTAGWAATLARLERHQLSTKVIEPKAGVGAPVHGGKPIQAALTLHPALFEEHPCLTRAFDALAGLAPSPMGVELLRAVVAEDEPDALDEALELACTLRIVSRQGEGDDARYRMHRLVREVYRGERGGHGGFDGAALDRLARWFEARRHDAVGTEVFGDDAPHLEAACAEAPIDVSGVTRARLRWLVAHVAAAHGRYEEALAEVEAAGAALGEADDPSLRFSLALDRANLVGHLGADRAAAKAIEALVEGMDDRPLDPARRLDALNALVYQLDRLEQYPRAREVARDAVARAERDFGAGHWRAVVARSRRALAESRLGGDEAWVDEARRAHADLTRVLGAADICSLNAHSALAVSLDYAGLSRAASQTYCAVWEECATTIGPQHSGTLYARVNLAQSLNNRGQCADAGGHARAALVGLRRLYAQDHPHVVFAKLQLLRSALGAHNQGAPRVIPKLEALRDSLAPDHQQRGPIDKLLTALRPLKRGSARSKTHKRKRR